MSCRCANDSKHLTQVYWVKSKSRFILIDYEDDVAIGDWVMTEDSKDRIVIESYRNQAYYGVVVWLEDWWNRNSRRYADAR